ncbi:hypothetical protein ACGFYV_02595 [Streptomyces sp. NPDC048297]|uniref:hypothetical protein n=1 Tax=Streptomyces sp. NPDC048297 TaxID=3365531 RepID=UPI0037144B15
MRTTGCGRQGEDDKVSRTHDRTAAAGDDPGIDPDADVAGLLGTTTVVAHDVVTRPARWASEHEGGTTAS